ncbi:hypothetical protein Gbem_0670 [Citrifermentans bemidjiense Bem]|uniref:Uncharacterized protein n=1 Tax=Citrifermentans bemidjiense (strain ATCC BAA-1014 / DSM 16622 / JCM 12645 / Bem) TaxID=404380 RepID=B5EDB1_CITBB|nr:hypothetical protein [Citrifermentans bemidjiense]ACH37697.1 hypothetical protein Gbem_0670 [Citrifermentans bemidjiense Bem]
MKLLSAATASLLVTGTQALAASGAKESTGLGLAGIVFIAFIAVVILFQLRPGLNMFVDIVKGIFSSEAESRAQDAVKENKTGV